MEYFVSARTHVGLKRITNEDNFSVGRQYMPAPARRSYALSAKLPECVLSVCDGMGGEAYGEEASMIGVKTFADSSAALLCADIVGLKAAVDRCINAANRDICAEMLKKKARMGSTAVLLLVKDGRADIFNVGDSRAYLLHKGVFSQLSKDHTVLQQKIDMGAAVSEDSPNPSEKHQLTQHLGILESEMLIEAFHTDVRLEDGDVLLACSDGLTDMVPNEDIAAVCAALRDANAVSAALVDSALKHGGRDNVTAAVVFVRDGERPG